MKINNINNTYTPLSASPPMTKEHFTKAIKGYKDEYLCGLTDEEREKIQKEIKAYIDSIPKGEKVDLNVIREMTMKLLKQYGYKGNLNDMTATIIHDTKEKLAKERFTSTDAAIAYEKLTQSPTTPSCLENITLSPAPEAIEESQNHVITNPDGSKSLVIIEHNTIIATIQLNKPCSLMSDTPDPTQLQTPLQILDSAESSI